MFRAILPDLNEVDVYAHVEEKTAHKQISGLYFFKPASCLEEYKSQLNLKAYSCSFMSNVFITVFLYARLSIIDQRWAVCYSAISR
jgi:hypothetical protein